MIRPANSSRAAKAVLAVVALVLLSSCASLPRIIILHDALTPEEHLNLGVAYEKKGDLDAAMKQYRAASKKLPVAYEYMGNVCFGKKDFSQAEKYYKKAIEKDPGNPDAYNNLAWLYYTEKIKMDDALRLATTATSLKVSDPSREALYRDTLKKIRQYLSSAGNSGR
ncbi:MAG: tetratricopeptide repeat protein [Nitrospiraceae bacterium]|nr:tetratricopeptide repeat protein [Nitrospiraceae bacterium]